MMKSGNDIRFGIIYLLLICFAPVYISACQPFLDNLSIIIPTGEAQLPNKQYNYSLTPSLDQEKPPTPTYTDVVLSDNGTNEAVCLKAVAGTPLDITIPDKTRLSPGDTFTKTWRIKNAGSCEWTPEFSIVWEYGNRLGAVQQKNLKNPVKPGEEIDISIEMTAPNVPGAYISYWKLQDATGQRFGIGPSSISAFWVSVEVIELVTSTPTNAPSPTPTDSVYKKLNVELSVGEYYDLDTNQTTILNGADLVLRKTYAMEMILNPVNGVQIVESDENTPTLKDCLSQLSNPTVMQIKIDDTVISKYYCYITDHGLPGYFSLQSYDMIESRISLDYVIWSVP